MGGLRNHPYVILAIIAAVILCAVDFPDPVDLASDGLGHSFAMQDSEADVIGWSGAGYPAWEFLDHGAKAVVTVDGAYHGTDSDSLVLTGNIVDGSGVVSFEDTLTMAYWRGVETVELSEGSLAAYLSGGAAGKHKSLNYWVKSSDTVDRLSSVRDRIVVIDRVGVNGLRITRPGVDRFPASQLAVLMNVPGVYAVHYLISIFIGVSLAYILMWKYRSRLLSTIFVVTVSACLVDQGLRLTGIALNFGSFFLTYLFLTLAAFYYRKREQAFGSNLRHVSTFTSSTPLTEKWIVAARVKSYHTLMYGLSDVEKRAFFLEMEKRYQLLVGDAEPFEFEPGVFIWSIEAGCEADVIDTCKAAKVVFQQPITTSAVTAAVTIFFGLNGDSDVGTEDRVRSAHLAAINAEKDGKLFSSSSDTELLALRTNELLLADIDRGLKDSEFYMVYQPKVCLRTGDVLGYEALCRWGHENGCGPGTFIPLCERNGRCLDLLEYVLNDVADEWKSMSVPVSVNVSPTSLKDERIIELLSGVLESSNLDPSLLTLELIETGEISPTSEVMDRLQQLTELGISLSLDDFGTGYASFENLSKFHVSELKIDRSFIQDITTNRMSQKIVASAAGFGKDINATVVAEGVETLEELEALRKMDVDIGQGYYFGRPVRFEDINKSDANKLIAVSQAS